MERWRLNNQYLKIRWRKGNRLEINKGVLELCYGVDGEVCGVNIPVHSIDLERLKVNFSKDRDGRVNVMLRESNGCEHTNHIGVDNKIGVGVVDGKIVGIGYFGS